MASQPFGWVIGPMRVFPKALTAPKSKGFVVWARGELNHLKTPMNAGLQAVRAHISAISGYLAVRGAPDAPPGGTCPTRLQLDARFVGAGSSNRKIDDSAPTTLRPAASIAGDRQVLPADGDGRRPPTESSVTERVTAESVPAPVAVDVEGEGRPLRVSEDESFRRRPDHGVDDGGRAAAQSGKVGRRVPDGGADFSLALAQFARWMPVAVIDKLATRCVVGTA
jgi:hypothetical protein